VTLPTLTRQHRAVAAIAKDLNVLFMDRPDGVALVLNVPVVACVLIGLQCRIACFAPGASGSLAGGQAQSVRWTKQLARRCSDVEGTNPKTSQHVETSSATLGLPSSSASYQCLLPR